MLLPGVVLEFDDPELAGCTVGDVLDDPDAFVGETLADPIEGVEDGRCKAKIMRGGDGTPCIHSFAHGRIHLRAQIRRERSAGVARLATATDAVPTLVRLVGMADLDAVETDGAAAAGEGLSERRRARYQRALLKAADKEQDARRNAAARTRAAATRRIRDRCSVRRCLTPRGCRRWPC